MITRPKRRRTPNYNGTPEYYKYFRKLHPTLRKKVTPKLFRDVITDFNLLVTDKIVENGFEFITPGFGRIAIFKRKSKIKKFEDGRFNLPINWKATFTLWKNDASAKEQKKYIYHMNEHTNGWIAKIYWIRNKVIPCYDNLRNYEFQPVERFTKLVYPAIMYRNSMDNYPIFVAFTDIREL